MAATCKLITILFCTIISLSSIDTAPTHLRPLNDQPSLSEDRSRRQVLGESDEIVQIQTQEICPVYVDGSCDKVQDVLCASDQLLELVNMELRSNSGRPSQQSVQLCQPVMLPTNNIRSLHQDFQTLASLFDKVAHDRTDSSMSRVQCKLGHIRSFLGETIDQFCEESCNTARNISCDATAIEPNEELQYVREEFGLGCMINLLQSLRVVLNNLNNYLTSFASEGVCSPNKCFRATREQEDALEAFKRTLDDQQQSFPSSNTWLNETECRPSAVFEMSVSGLYELVTATAKDMSTLPSQINIVESLNTTVLPLLHETVLPIVGGAELDSVIPATSLIENEDVSLTSCLVTRLSVAFEALLHNKLRHEWTILNRDRDTGCI